MRGLQLSVLLFLFSFPMGAQSCPAVNFRSASQVNVAGPGRIIGGLQRLSDGSFTLHSYSYSTTGATQIGTTPQFQNNFLSCTGRSAQPVIPPANWNFLTNPLLGTMPRNPASGDLLGPGTSVGICLNVCNVNKNLMQMAVGTPTFNYSSIPTYTVDSNATGILLADLNNDGLGDVFAIDYQFIYVFLMQAGGTLLPRPNLTTAGGSISSAVAADLDGDGKIDLAVADTSANTITIFLGNGDGTFRSLNPVNTGTFPLNIAVADVNGDSKLDLVATTENGIAVHFGNGDGTFQPAQKYPTPGFASAIAVADLNKDGKPDLVEVDENDGVVEVLLNAGNGTFPNATAYVIGFPEDSFQLFLMDFDWDGNTDIVFGAGHPDALTPLVGSEVITVLFGNGDGTFAGTPAYPIAGDSNSDVGGLAIADFTGDGKLDALAGSTSGISLLIGHGDGTFTPQTLPLQQGSSSLAAGDFNHDGKMDFVATSSDGISVFLGAGNGTFQQSASIHTASGGITSAAVGDFNGDSKLDFAVVDSQGGTTATASVYLGNGDGTFQNARMLMVGSMPQKLQAADVNQDGKLDLVVTNYGTLSSSSDPGSVMVLLGNGDGTFQPAIPYPMGSNPWFTLVADINADGKLDLITSTELNPDTFTYGLSVRLNQGNGVFSAAQSIESDFGPTEIGAADFNGDGKVDLLVAHCCGDTQMGYFLGNGDGTFQSEVLFVSGTGQVNLRVADLNGDGKPDAMFTLYGPYAAVLTNVSVASTAITIQTNPAGLQFSVDGGTAQTAPQTLNLSQGAHTIAVATPQPGATGTQYVFTGWSDSGAASHSITVGASAATYTASFKTQYRLTISASPAAGGTVTPASGTFYDAGSVVPITATPNAGYTFTGWTGTVASASSASTTATMSAALTVTANFSNGQAPPVVTVFSPGQGATGVPTNTTLTWGAVTGAASYTVYFGTSNPPPSATSTTGTSYSPSMSPNTTYYWSVTAVNTSGSTPSATWSFTTGTGTVSGYRFVPVTPCRIMDTRGATGMFGGPSIAGGATRSVPIPLSSCSIPSTAQAYSLNITVVPPGPLTYLSIWPTGQAQPVVSTLNSLDGRIVANAAIVPAGTNGAISVYASNTTDVIIDINGYFAPASTSGSMSFYAATPCRVVDTRGATGAFGGPFMSGGSTRSFAIPSSSCGIPSAAQAYSLNITVIPHVALQYLSTWPAGQSQPLVSTLNSLDGSIVANAAIVPAGTSGAVSVFVTNDTDLIIDINGYFAPAGSSGALSLYTLTPCRVVDTRGATGTFGGPSLPANGTRSFPIPSSACSVPSTAQAYSLNVTVVPPGTLTYLTAWPTGQTQPVVSTLNSPGGKVVANAAIVPAGTSGPGGVSIFVSNATDVILDINAYFAQ